MKTSRMVCKMMVGMIALWVYASGIEPVNPNLDNAGREVLNYLESVYGKKCLFGYVDVDEKVATYNATARYGAIFCRDAQWTSDEALTSLIERARRNRFIVTFQWHWFFDGESAWTGQRKNSVDMGNVVTPGTDEYNTALDEIDKIAGMLKKLENAGIPVLWRPLHEIDGGWFWWTDKENPENTAELWRIMYDRMTNHHQLNNLIWVYSAGVGNLSKKPVEFRKRFYPGPEYVDISGIDIYGVDFQTDSAKYNEYWDIMTQVTPGKMLALCEGDAVPNPDLMESGKTPKWLYALPWWRAGANGHTVEYALETMNHDFIVTLEELPPFGSTNISPHIGIIDPLDDGSGWFESDPTFVSYAIDRDGSVEKTLYFADDSLIGSTTTDQFVWQNAVPGCYHITAATIDNSGDTAYSNFVRTGVKMVDLAKNKPVTTKPESDDGGLATDGDYYTTWSPTLQGDKWKDAVNDSVWIQVDLGDAYSISSVNSLWDHKIVGWDYSIEVALENPENENSWTTVYEIDRPNPSWNDVLDHLWKATFRDSFEPVEARYVRLRLTDRLQGWGAYSLQALEIPVPVQDAAQTRRPLIVSTREFRGPDAQALFTVNGRLVRTIQSTRAHSAARTGIPAGVYITAPKIRDGATPVGRILLTE